MSKLGINTGTSPDSGTGDSLLVGGIKINSNFDEIYGALGIGSTTIDVGFGKTVITVLNGSYNVGFGSTQPTSKIDVIGNAKFSGVVTAFSFSGQLNSTNASITNLSGTIGTITTLGSTNGTITNLSGTIGTITTLGSTNGTITTLGSTNASITNLSGTIGTITTLGSTNGTITNLSGTIGTITTLESTNASITNLSGTIGTITNLSGTIGTITTLGSTNASITNLSGTIGTITTLESTNASITNLSGNNLSYLGVSTFTSGPVLIGSGSSTGTTSQRLQVTGGAYVSDSVGIGTTNPISKFTVVDGDISVGVNTSTGLILTSPNGTRYRLFVNNSGVVGTSTV